MWQHQSSSLSQASKNVVSVVANDLGDDEGYYTNLLQAQDESVEQNGGWTYALTCRMGEWLLGSSFWMELTRDCTK